MSAATAAFYQDLHFDLYLIPAVKVRHIRHYTPRITGVIFWDLAETDVVLTTRRYVPCL